VGPGRGVIENQHSTDVIEYCHPPWRVCMSNHLQGTVCSDLGRVGGQGESLVAPYTRGRVSLSLSLSDVGRVLDVADPLAREEIRAKCRRCDATACPDGHALRKCARCQVFYYCSKACQLADFPEHKKIRAGISRRPGKVKTAHFKTGSHRPP